VRAIEIVQHQMCVVWLLCLCVSTILVSSQIAWCVQQLRIYQGVLKLSAWLCLKSTLDGLRMSRSPSIKQNSMNMFKGTLVYGC